MENKTTAIKPVNLFLPFRITSADTDAFARLKMGALINFLVEGAIQSADSLGFGYSGLKKSQLFWVLSRISIEIYSEIRWYDRIILETWPKDIDGFHYLRDFIIRSEDGRELIKATSAWLAIDLETKRIRTLDGELLNSLHRDTNRHALRYAPEKLLPVKSDQTYNRIAHYQDLDLNKHVTSARYVDWIMDDFPMDFHKKWYPEYLCINFLKETLPGNELLIRKLEQTPGEFLFEADNLDRKSQAFRGKIRFKEEK